MHHLQQALVLRVDVGEQAVADTERIEQRPRRRRDELSAHLAARKCGLLDDGYAPARPRQQKRRSRACGTASNDDRVVT